MVGEFSIRQIVVEAHVLHRLLLEGVALVLEDVNGPSHLKLLVEALTVLALCIRLHEN